MRAHLDKRAARFCDLFEDTPGDVNLFVLHNPGEISAWHRHSQQVDQFVLVNGSVLFGMSLDGDEKPEFIRLYNEIDKFRAFPKITIKPGAWHGYQNIGTRPAMLLMYLSHKYEDGWDEERRTLEEMPWNP